MLDISFCIWLSYIYIFISYLWIHKHCTLKCVYFWFQHTNLQLSWCLLQNSENMCVAFGAQCTKHFVTPSIPHWCKETTPHAKACVLSFSMLHWCARSWCHSASCADVKETVLLSIPCWCKGSCATQHVTQHAALTQKKLLSFSMTCWCKRSCCHSAWRADAKEAAAHSACWAEIIGNPGEGPIAMNLGPEAMNVTSL